MGRRLERGHEREPGTTYVQRNKFSEGFEVCLIEPGQASRCGARPKTDVLDAQWLQRLHSHGLLRGSFRPPDVVIALRAYLRQRLMLISYASSHIQHMQKATEQMNMKLAEVVSEITGLTGMRIITIEIRCQEPILGTLMQENRFSVPDTSFFLNLHGRYPVIPDVPAAPMAAFIVGFAVYFACAKIGLISPVISMPNRADVLLRQERSSQTRNHGTTPPYGRELPPGRTRKGEVDSDSLFRVFRWIPWLISDPSGAAIGCCWTESAVRICADLGCRGNIVNQPGY